MPDETRNHVDDLRGAGQLAVEATKGVTALVEAMHRAIAEAASTGSPVEATAAAISKVVYGGVRGVTGLVGGGIDRALGQLAPLVGEAAPSAEREAVLAAVNGVLGDYLEATNNPLVLPMQLRHGGIPLRVDEAGSVRSALTRATGRMLVMVHGSCMHDGQWLRSGHDHGLALTRDAGWTRIGARYNSGRHISDNGAELSRMIDALAQAWPVPLEEIALVGHSMGGLVSRSACRAAEDAGHRWRSTLRTLVTLGTPHHGSPLERGGNGIDVLLGGNRYSAPLARLGKIRSAGVTDLRYGNVLAEHWQGRDRFEPGEDPRSPTPLPDGVGCYAVAATLRGVASDGLVPLASALGQHDDPAHALGFPPSHTLTVQDAGHLDLLNRPDVYAQLRAWLCGAR